MKTSDFYYDLPKELIAQHPLKDRAASRLLALDKITGEISHRTFSEVVDYFNSGDVLVRNYTRVIPARLLGDKVGSNARVEVLLIKPITQNNDEELWEVMVKPGKKLKVGAKVCFGNRLSCTIVEETSIGRVAKFHYEGIFNEILSELGNMPLPPYIEEKLEDKERYQTVYSKIEGSAAAPTAGLHFTEDIFSELRNKGVIIVDVLLHVGLGTFKPVKTENILDHNMHSEYYEISEETARTINEAKEKGHKIIAVGTTSARALESCAHSNKVVAASGYTDIFIYPGYEWQIVDSLITNFHLPESTLMMLVSALAGRENIMKAYSSAVEKKYRFFSFGDAMLIN